MGIFATASNSPFEQFAPPTSYLQSCGSVKRAMCACGWFALLRALRGFYCAEPVQLRLWRLPLAAFSKAAQTAGRVEVRRSAWATRHRGRHGQGRRRWSTARDGLIGRTAGPPASRIARPAGYNEQNKLPADSDAMRPPGRVSAKFKPRRWCTLGVKLLLDAAWGAGDEPIHARAPRSGPTTWCWGTSRPRAHGGRQRAIRAVCRRGPPMHHRRSALHVNF
jgi:hypothetical protein